MSIDQSSGEACMIIDIGTGNVRVAITGLSGKPLSVARDNVHYQKDERYPEALHFDPDQLWNQIIGLGQQALDQAGDVPVKAITASSQREGIVLLDREGHSLIGLPNHDHRGRQWEGAVKNKGRIYGLTGRYPSSLFSALKLKGIEQKRPDLWKQTDSFLSVSDWAQYKLSGVARYEHSQASETQLYSVKDKSWSEELVANFELSVNRLPELVAAGTELGSILSEPAGRWNLPADIPVIAGGADTQLAMKSTRPEPGDIVIVSGTTTPVTKIMDSYYVDHGQRTWTNRDIEEDRFILEANAGVTGLNYQRLKTIFYPDVDYQTMEKEIAEIDHSQCIASLGSLVAGEQTPLVRGGFMFDVPVSHELTRADFAWATLWDIACSIKENYDTLDELSSHSNEYVWTCSGGMQSPMLRQFISGLIGKELRIRRGYRQASVVGAALLCSETLGYEIVSEESAVEKVVPEDRDKFAEWYEEWKDTRSRWRQFSE